ncbi:MAG: hypothetical protein BMS9Abin26_0703 [Gammaproteobacteria bacterium]|nr:MAG: hypothetical protein BMS9Abin26_0703 [Gammaproteobacteria bacterium]
MQPGKQPGSRLTNLIRWLSHFGLASWERIRPASVPIAYKMAISISILIIIGMGTLGSIIINNQRQLLTKQINELGQTVVNQSAEASKEMILAEDKLGLSVLTNNLTNDNSILGATIINKDGRILSQSGIMPIIFNGKNIIETNGRYFSPEKTNLYEWTLADTSINDKISVTSFITPIQFKEVHIGYTLVTFNRSLLDVAIQDSVRAITAATALMILLAVVLSFLMGKSMSRPIMHLMDASRAIVEGKYNYRISERRNDEIGILIESFNNMAEGLLQKNQVENAFSRYVSPSVAKEVLRDLGHVELGSKHVTGSVLFADIVDYTSISSKLEPTEIVELLNEYFSYINQVSKLFKGHIDKFMGDCAMIVFGIPESDPDHSFNAISCAVMIQRVVELMNRKRVANGKLPVQFKLGVNTGEMLAGNLGSSERMEYTVVGDSVNLASRLCSFASPGQVVISGELYSHEDIRSRIIAEPHASIHLRHRIEPIETFIIKDLNPEYTQMFDERIIEIFENREVA